VLLTEEEKQFSIEVGDEAPHIVPGDGTPGAEGAVEAEAEAEEDEMGLAVISGLVDDVEVTTGENGGLIRMSWPTTPPGPFPA
jgi:Histidine kinase-like ATPase domain